MLASGNYLSFFVNWISPMSFALGSIKLTETEKHNLRNHVYRSQGCSILEKYILKDFWNWLTDKFPLWLAPNLITLAGFVVTVAGTLSVLLQDRQGKGEAPSWALIFCAIGIFVYQTLDGCDGKQARRTGTSSPLGELFDHGCDALATLLYAIVAACTAGLVEYPYLMLLLVFTMVLICYCYQWQAYVSGILYFNIIDVAEAHYAQIVSLLLTALIGIDVWHHQTLLFLGVPFTLKLMFASGTILFGVLDIMSAAHIILTKGTGRNGSSVAGTSVLSPIITPVMVMLLTVGYTQLSPGQLWETNSVLFLTVMFTPITKASISFIVAIMTKSPVPLVDPLLLGPLLALINAYYGAIVPELLVFVCLAVFNVYNILSLFVNLLWEFSEVLNMPCFTIPPKKDN